MMQDQLFIRDPESTEGLRVPKFTKEESNLKYRVYEDVPRGLGVMDDTPVTIREFTIPVIIARDKNGNEIHFKYCTQQYFAGVPEMINDWMKTETSRTHFKPARDWIIENADELNYARRYYIMKNREDSIQALEEKISQAKADLAWSKVSLNIDIIQVREDRWVFGDERKTLMIEFGGSTEE